jgi:hypothetical protein
MIEARRKSLSIRFHIQDFLLPAICPIRGMALPFAPEERDVYSLPTSSLNSSLRGAKLLLSKGLLHGKYIFSDLHSNCFLG